MSDIDTESVIVRFYGDSERYLVEWVKRAGEGEGNCGKFPTKKHCPSWVVAKFKARSCNPHTGRRLRFLFYHDSAVVIYLTAYHLFN